MAGFDSIGAGLAANAEPPPLPEPPLLAVLLPDPPALEHPEPPDQPTAGYDVVHC